MKKLDVFVGISFIVVLLGGMYFIEKSMIDISKEVETVKEYIITNNDDINLSLIVGLI